MSDTGPTDWRNLTKPELDAAYSQRNFAPNMDEVLARWRSQSEMVRSELGESLHFAYGDEAIESMMVFPAEQPNTPILILIHGGAWNSETAASHVFPAACFVDAGVNFVVPDFSWVQDVEHSLFPIVEQLRNFVRWVHQNADTFGGDADQIFVAGHSSGGHLAGALLTTEWEAEQGLPADVIKGGMCCSGVFELEPVRHSHRGGYIAFTDEMVQELSPLRHLERLTSPLIVAHGGDESPEFIRQSVQFAAAARDAGANVNLISAPDYNHFEILETLADPNGVLGQAVLGQIKMTGP